MIARREFILALGGARLASNVARAESPRSTATSSRNGDGV